MWTQFARTVTCGDGFAQAWYNLWTVTGASNCTRLLARGLLVPQKDTDLCKASVVCEESGSSGIPTNKRSINSNGTGTRKTFCQGVGMIMRDERQKTVFISIQKQRFIEIQVILSARYSFARKEMSFYKQLLTFKRDLLDIFRHTRNVDINCKLSRSHLLIFRAHVEHCINRFYMDITQIRRCR